MTTTITSNSASPSAAQPKRKPRVSLAIATALGLGYMPKAPGTFGSLAAVALAALSPNMSGRIFFSISLEARNGCQTGPCEYEFVHAADPVYFEIALLVLISFVGVWTASRVAKYLGSKDPQIVVIDEVSGQYLTLLVGSLWPFVPVTNFVTGPGSLVARSAWVTIAAHPLNWKCLLAGFILFRVFDIWKPFPARQAESLPRGWGIMADDWIAGLYAALGLWILRAIGL